MIQGVDDLHVHEVEYYDDLTGTTTVDGFATGVDLDTAPGSDGDGRRRRHHVPRHDRRRLGARRRRDQRRLRQPLHRVQPDLAVEDVLVRRRPRAGRRRHRGDRRVDRPQRRQPARQGVPRRRHGEVPSQHHRPGRGGADGDWPLESATGISELSKNSNFSFQVSAEAYPLVALGLGTGLGFSWSNTYFSDVNGDGLVDFVTGGTVYFNTLDADGIPTFSTSSAGTPIPLDPSPLPDLSSAELAELSATLDLQSPPIDTVRRFIAPVHRHHLDRRRRRARQRGREQHRRRPRRHPAQRLRARRRDARSRWADVGVRRRRSRSR